MKRNLLTFLVLALLMTMAACGQTSGPAPTVIATAESVPSVTEQTVEPQNGVYAVSNVEELVAAIGPNREIRLAEGTYDLSASMGYGRSTENPYVIWQETYDGYELVIRDVKNLSIVGAGKELSVLSAQPRYANVLLFRNCENLFLSGITAGHTQEPGYCIGGVIDLEGCANVSIWEVGLYGCGVTGVAAQGCANVSVTNSDIYDCSYNGIQLADSRDVYVVNCRLFDQGKEDWEAFEVFRLSDSANVTISDCEIFDNRVQSLVHSFGVEQVALKNNVFRGNAVSGCAFGTFGNFVTLDGNTFQQDVIHQWFEEGCGAVDAEGNTITEDMLNGILPEQTPAAVEKVTVTVTDVDAFLAAIAPNTEIVLDGELFDFAAAKDYGGGPKKYYRWEDTFDGPGLVITGVDNLTIRSKDGNRANHTIVAEPRYANVLSFRGCKGLVLSGFTAGHTQEAQGECTGGVIDLQNCEKIAVENCGMYGCGILGVQAFGCTDITLRGCEIYECSYGGVQMMDVTGVVMENCTFRDLGGNNLMFENCSDVVADGEPLNGQHYDGR